ncbi:hypothetical protein FHS34_007723 [Streptomyces echinatus]|uniref:Uncharacterized protein n=1 Tax=Streptomyces echinatus TaxID=67293 RepID=A0A7W9Q2M1_9ACTN|nr:hypothetical protein [Streptomyces echinatus]
MTLRSRPYARRQRHAHSMPSSRRACSRSALRLHDHRLLLAVDRDLFGVSARHRPARTLSLREAARPRWKACCALLDGRPLLFAA